MFGIGGFELLLIVVFVLMVFGPDKLPEIGKMVGRGIRMFNDARHEVESVVRTEILRPEDIEAFGTITGKRPYTPRTAATKEAGPEPGSARRELELKRQAEARVAEVAKLDAEAAAAAAAKPLAVAQAEARAAEAAKRAAEAEAIAAEASLRAAEAEAAAAAIAAGQSE